MFRDAREGHHHTTTQCKDLQPRTITPTNVFLYTFRFNSGRSYPTKGILRKRPQVLQCIPGCPTCCPTCTNTRRQGPKLRCLQLSTLQKSCTPSFPVSKIRVAEALRTTGVARRAFQPLFFKQHGPFKKIPSATSGRLHLSTWTSLPNSICQATKQPTSGITSTSTKQRTNKKVRARFYPPGQCIIPGSATYIHIQPHSAGALRPKCVSVQQHQGKGHKQKFGGVCPTTRLRFQGRKDKATPSQIQCFQHKRLQHGRQAGQDTKGEAKVGVPIHDVTGGITYSLFFYCVSSRFQRLCRVSIVSFGNFTPVQL